MWRNLAAIPLTLSVLLRRIQVDPPRARISPFTQIGVGKNSGSFRLDQYRAETDHRDFHG